MHNHGIQKFGLSDDEESPVLRSENASLESQESSWAENLD